MNFTMGFSEVTDLEKQTVTSSVITKNNVVTETGRSYIEHPKIWEDGAVEQEIIETEEI